jgi:hypothetical protein
MNESTEKKVWSGEQVVHLNKETALAAFSCWANVVFAIPVEVVKLVYGAGGDLQAHIAAKPDSAHVADLGQAEVGDDVEGQVSTGLLYARVTRIETFGNTRAVYARWRHSDEFDTWIESSKVRVLSRPSAAS